ncbi:neuroligin-4, X-linked [Octopus bimaculoides]|nr:neuroligin-4, X-linked [Octopus bimaculoides]
MGGSLTSPFIGSACVSILLVVLVLNIGECVVYMRTLSDRVVTTRYGTVRGVMVEFPNRHLKPVDAYLGLPYASLLRGNLRFMPPTSPMEKWTGTRVVLDMSPVCPQKVPDLNDLKGKVPESRYEHYKRIAPLLSKQLEDCLSLNLYVPRQEWNNTNPMPVMVFIHGESYDSGSGNVYDGSVLASFGEVIVVTVNYRLGVLGFLSTGDGTASGNYATLDQIAALHWLKENIESFNGDKQRVTLFGHGHGAALVNLLLVSPVTKDGTLFQRAILQSGSALSSWSVANDPIGCTHQLALSVNCSIDDSQDLIKCLRNKTFSDLVKNAPKPPKYFSCFAPVIDGKNIIPKSVEELIKKPVSMFSNADLMFGITKNEAYSYFDQEDVENGISEEKKEKMLRTYVHNRFQFHRQKVYEILDHHYAEWSKKTTPKNRRDSLLELLSDGQYIAPLLKVGQLHAKTGNTYFYYFTYTSQSEEKGKLSGGDELPYIFGAPLVDGIQPFSTSSYSKSERMLSEAVMRYWTNFAKSGDPNKPVKQESVHGGRVINRFMDLNWPKYEEEEQKYIHIGRRPNVKEYYRGQKISVWLELLPKIHKPDNCSPEHHRLDNSNNMSTYDEPDRLFHFTDVFPSPPPVPPITPPPKSHSPSTNGGPSTPPPNGYNVEYANDLSTGTTPDYAMDDRRTTTGTNSQRDASSAIKEGESIVPLSITVAVGCSLLFLNILIFAGVYYQRERMKKSRREKDDMDEIKLSRKIEKESNKIGGVSGVGSMGGGMGGSSIGGPETVSLMSTPPTQSSPTRQAQHNNPSNNSSKQNPSKIPASQAYSYSALPTTSSSPLHRASNTPSSTLDHPTKGSSPSRKVIPNAIKSKDSMESSKKSHRSSGIDQANNAITIV